MKVCLFRSIIELDLKIGILIEESTTLSKKTTLIICIRTMFPDFRERVILCSVVALSNTSALSIVVPVLSCLHKHGFT